MQPQFRVYRNTAQQYYFQFITSDERMIFESIRFPSKPLCAKAIRELQTIGNLDSYIHKIDHEHSFSYVLTNKKKTIVGGGHHHWGFMTRNLDIRQLIQELQLADIVEDHLEPAR